MEGPDVWERDTAEIACNEVSRPVCIALKLFRSEERRVGKECRSRWSPDH